MIPKKKQEVFVRISENHQLTKVQLESEFLSEHYLILASNSQMAYYILSPVIQDSLEELIRKLKVIPVISFREGKMNMAFPRLKQFFTFPNKKPIKELSYFDVCMNEISFFEKLIKHFNLETRIWTKV